MSRAEEPEDLASPERRLVDPRSLAVRFSTLKHLARSPAHYFAACQGQAVDTPARKAGRAGHAAALGTPLAVWDRKTSNGSTSPRRGKDWEAFKAEHPGAEIVTPAEAEPALAIAASVKAHPRAAELLYAPGTLREHKVSWSYLGRRCESHLDVVRPGHVLADLKCLKDGSPDRVKKVVWWDHYVVQLAAYRLAVESRGWPAPKTTALVVVENTPPYAVTVYPVTEAALEQGRKTWHLWFEQLLACERANAWPGYAQTDVPIDVADQPAERFTVTVGGEDLEL